MDIHLIRVGGLLHHGTQDPELHWTYAADLRMAGHEVTAETRPASTQEKS